MYLKIRYDLCFVGVKSNHSSQRETAKYTDVNEMPRELVGRNDYEMIKMLGYYVMRNVFIYDRLSFLHWNRRNT
jgi:hypothetical protein